MSKYLDRVRKENKRLAKTVPKRKKAPKVSKAEFNRSWGIPGAYRLRWRGLRGVVWYFMSRSIRKEEFEEYGGKCVSCPVILARWEDGQLAHYISVSRSLGMSLIRKNVALSCARCNNPTWSPDASIPFGVEIDRRYGNGTALSLYEQSRKFNDLPGEIELLALIEQYRNKEQKDPPQ